MKMKDNAIKSCTSLIFKISKKAKFLFHNYQINMRVYDYHLKLWFNMFLSNLSAISGQSQMFLFSK